MKFSQKILLLFAVVFALSAGLISVLLQGVAANEREWKENNLALSASVSAAYMAAADMSFAGKENLAKACADAGLRALDVELIDGIAPSENPHIYGDDKGNLVCDFYVGLENGKLVRARAAIEPEYVRFSFVSLLTWALGGLIFGAVIGLFVGGFIVRRLRAVIDEFTSDSNGENKDVRIIEFGDLIETLKLLRALAKKRKAKEYLRANKFVSERALESKALALVMPETQFSVGNYRAYLDYASSGSGASFYFKGDDFILYGRLSGEKQSLKTLPSAILARDLSAKYITEMSAKESYEKLSKIFKLSQWNVLKFKDGGFIREGYDGQEWTSRRFDGAGSELFNTLESGKLMRFYSKLDLSKGGERLKYISSLAPKSESGLFILIEKNENS